MAQCAGPPFTLSLSCGMPSSRIGAIATTAKASDFEQVDLVSDHPVLASSVRIAPIGAVVNHSGSCEWVAWPTMRAQRAMPRPLASSSVSRTTAAAPSEMLEELAAVTLPSLKAGRRVGILAMSGGRVARRWRPRPHPAGGDLHRDDLVGECPIGLCGLCALTDSIA